MKHDSLICPTPIALPARTTQKTKEPNAGGVLPWNSVPRLVGVVCLSSVWGWAISAEVPGVVWQGELEVRQHAGSDCRAQPALPYRLPVWGVAGTQPGGQPGRWLLWGDMQPVEGLADPNGGATLSLLANGVAAGSLVWNAHGAKREGRWREPAGSDGCSFVDAVLRLTPLQGIEADEAALRFSTYLTDVYAAQRELAAAQSVQSAKVPLARLVRLAGELPDALMANKSLAWAFMQGGQRATKLRQADASLALHEASSVLYRRVASQYPEDAALALAAHARTLYRYRGLERAMPLVAESLALLERTGRSSSAAAASVLNMRGAWLLNKGQTEAALASFAQAVRVNEQIGAPLQEYVASLMNMAAAFEDARNLKEALALYARAIEQLGKADELTDPLKALQGMLQERVKSITATQNLQQI